MDAGAYQTAGLYDPAAPGAADRLAVLEWLAARSITTEQMVRAPRETSLTGLAGDLALNPGRRLDAAALAARIGWTTDQVLASSLAAGLKVEPGEPAYDESDMSLFASFTGGASLVGATALRRFTHTIGAAMASVAEAAVSLFQVNIEGPMRAEGRSELALAEQNLRAVEALGRVQAMIHGLFRAHVNGPIVNLAARVAQLAVPSELLVTPEVAAGAAGTALRFEPAGKRMVKGLDEPVSLLAVGRA